MRSKAALTTAAAISPPEDRLVQDVACSTCGCQLWSKEIIEGREYLRCAGTWRNGDSCRRLQPIPILKEPPPVANLEGEAPSLDSSARKVGAGIADPAVARAAMIASAEAVARLRGGPRTSVMEEARGLQQMAAANRALRSGERSAPLSLDAWVAHVRSYK